MNQTPDRRAEIHKLYESPMSGQDIEDLSFRRIDEEAGEHGFPTDEWEVVRRMIHTTADFSLADSIRFSPDAVDSAVAALKGARPIYTDANMIRTGISLARLRQVSPEYSPDRVLCHVADEDIAAEASRSGLPRSLHAVRKAHSSLDGGIAVFGNAPVGLMELSRMILEDGIRPALIIGMPVGFVHVVESKQELMEIGVPHIVIVGRRGGSPLAVSTIHALCSLALRRA